jgi:hypothetical protein
LDWPGSTGALRHDDVCAFERARLQPRYRGLAHAIGPREIGLRSAFRNRWIASWRWWAITESGRQNARHGPWRVSCPHRNGPRSGQAANPVALSLPTHGRNIHHLVFALPLRLLRILDRLGCFGFRSALASICLMRSRVTENCWPISRKARAHLGRRRGLRDAAVGCADDLTRYCHYFTTRAWLDSAAVGTIEPLCTFLLFVGWGWGQQRSLQYVRLQLAQCKVTPCQS